MEGKEHICARMIQVIEGKGLTVTKFEETWKEKGKISVGYLRRSAKDGTNIGFDLIENFLSEFPETDVNWLITGVSLSTNTEKNITSVRDKKLLKEKQQLIDGLFINKKEADKLIDDLYNHIRTLEGLEGEQLPKHQASPSKN